MAKPYSMDLRERVVAAVVDEAMSCHASAARFGVAASSAIKWVRCVRETGSAAPGQMGGHKPNILSGTNRDWLLERAAADFTLRGLVAKLAERGVKVDYVQVWRFVHAEGLSFKKIACCPPNSSGRRSPGDASSGRNIRGGLIRRAWSSSTRPGPRPTWHHCAAGLPRGNASMPKCPMAIGKR